MSNKLVIGYEAYTRQRVKKWKALSPTDVIYELGMRTDREGVQVPITMNDLKLFVQEEAGDEVEGDVSCDSTFMLEKILESGEALRASFHWVPDDKTIYLFIDNAREHGTNDATAGYTGILWNKFKVEVVWQVPQSPETNMLDLGIWMSIQAAMTRVHYKRRCSHDALARSVVDAWNKYLSPDAFKNVF